MHELVRKAFRSGLLVSLLLFVAFFSFCFPCATVLEREMTLMHNFPVKTKEIQESNTGEASLVVVHLVRL